MFKLNTIEVDPTVVVEKQDHNGKPSYESEVTRGKFRRVYPTGCKEISALRMLEHHVEKFAPAACCGNGVIITEGAFRQFQNK